MSLICFAAIVLSATARSSSARARSSRFRWRRPETWRARLSESGHETEQTAHRNSAPGESLAAGFRGASSGATFAQTASPSMTSSMTSAASFVGVRATASRTVSASTAAADPSSASFSLRRLSARSLRRAFLLASFLCCCCRPAPTIDPEHSPRRARPSPIQSDEFAIRNSTGWSGPSLPGSLGSAPDATAWADRNEARSCLLPTASTPSRFALTKLPQYRTSVRHPSRLAARDTGTALCKSTCLHISNAAWSRSDMGEGAPVSGSTARRLGKGGKVAPMRRAVCSLAALTATARWTRLTRRGTCCHRTPLCPRTLLPWLVPHVHSRPSSVTTAVWLSDADTLTARPPPFSGSSPTTSCGDETADPPPPLPPL